METIYLRLKDNSYKLIYELFWHLDLDRSYLSNRKQSTEVNGVKSTVTHLICGVPQESILVPILFLIYVNDIKYSTDISISSFADDTTTYLSHNNIDDIYRITNSELTKMNHWFSANKLQLNTKKTKYILFGPKGNNITTNVTAGWKEFLLIIIFKYYGHRYISLEYYLFEFECR